MKLLEYINIHFSGSQSEFARHAGVARQQVAQWVSKGFIVVDGVLYSPRRSVL